MDILAKLKQQGWHLTEEGLKKLPVPDENRSDPGRIVKAALDVDLRDIAGGALPREVGRNKEDLIAGRVVLQVSKIRNISAPKANQESKGSPRFLCVEFTDGVTTIQSLEFQSVQALSLDTPPGTKVYFTCEKIPLMHGYIVLDPNDIKVLGGRVPALVEKWELSRTLQKYTRSGRMQMGGASGPPPWTPFGQKLKHSEVKDKNFKSLAVADKDKEVKENNEFDAMRSEAIAEAAKTGARKTFGGGNQPIMDHNVKKILAKGYSEQDAKDALKTTHNNLERALYNLKRRNSLSVQDDVSEKGRNTRESNRRGGGRDREGRKGREEEATSAKPAGNVSLFEFLSNKLPAKTDVPEPVAVVPAPKTSNYKPVAAVPTPKPEAAPKTSHYNPFKTNNHNPLNLSGKPNSSHEKNIPKQTSAAGAAAAAASKFENNISSSFANRTSSTDERDRGSRRGGHQANSRNNQRSTPSYPEPKRERDVNKNTGSKANPRHSQKESHPQNRSKPDNRQSSHQNGGGSNNKTDKKLAEDMQAKLKIDRGAKNGCAYDPSKIVGFQAKETNEYALNMLRAQGLAPVPAKPMPPMMMQDFGPPPMAFAPVQPAFVMPEAPPSTTWSWKPGDRCLAKYWDDGNYYDAEITGVSSNTCVVYFLGYDNYEEVLQADCIPITDHNNQTVNFSHQTAPPPLIPQLPQHPQQPTSFNPPAPAANRSNNANRYRGERKMYVPPPKRDN